MEIEIGLLGVGARKKNFNEQKGWTKSLYEMLQCNALFSMPTSVKTISQRREVLFWCIVRRRNKAGLY